MNSVVIIPAYNEADNLNYLLPKMPASINGKQVGVLVVDYGSDEDEDIPPFLYVTVNPKITRFSQEIVPGAEGCLSIPGFMGEVDRAQEIVVEGQDRFGKPLKMKFQGWIARIFQHEIDHINGILFTDRTTLVLETDEDYNPV